MANKPGFRSPSLTWQVVYGVVSHVNVSTTHFSVIRIAIIRASVHESRAPLRRIRLPFAPCCVLCLGNPLRLMAQRFGLLAAAFIDRDIRNLFGQLSGVETVTFPWP